MRLTALHWGYSVLSVVRQPPGRQLNSGSGFDTPLYSHDIINHVFRNRISYLQADNIFRYFNIVWLRKMIDCAFLDFDLPIVMTTAPAMMVLHNPTMHGWLKINTQTLRVKDSSLARRLWHLRLKILQCRQLPRTFYPWSLWKTTAVSRSVVNFRCGVLQTETDDSKVLLQYVSHLCYLPCLEVINMRNQVAGYAMLVCDTRLFIYPFLKWCYSCTTILWPWRGRSSISGPHPGRWVNVCTLPLSICHW